MEETREELFQRLKGERIHMIYEALQELKYIHKILEQFEWKCIAKVEQRSGELWIDKVVPLENKCNYYDMFRYDKHTKIATIHQALMPRQ